MKLFNRNKARTSVLERNQLIIGVVGTAFVVAGSAFSLLLSGGAQAAPVRPAEAHGGRAVQAVHHP